jgi:hydroxymethylglutaryl-CoA lyase
MARPASVRVFEVGPRDGLQNERAVLSVEQRVEFVRRLSGAGIRDIEIGSFVHPRWVPQMVGTDGVVAELPPVPGVTYWGLVPNARGLDRALAAGLANVCFVVSASETHSTRNLNKTVAAAVHEVEQLAAVARERHLAWRGYVSVAFGCPYEGDVDISSVLRLTGRLLALGAREVSLGDTTGMGSPDQVRSAARRAIAEFGADRVAFHFHDTRGLAVTNAFVVLEEGALCLDSSTGGIGGCPYAPGAAGNLATEDLVHLLDGMGIASGVDLREVVGVSRWLEQRAGIGVPARFYHYARSRGDL